MSVAYILLGSLILFGILILFLYGVSRQDNMRKRIICTWTVGLLCVGAATLCKYAAAVNPENYFPGILRSFIYIGMYYTWGRIVCRGVIQRTQRRCLGGIAAMLIFWVIASTCDHFIFPGQEPLERYLCYIYYIPQILIAALALTAALMADQGEEVGPGKWSGAVFGGAAVLILLVMTNDLHQMFFSFRENEAQAQAICIPEPGYCMLIALIMGCSFCALFLFVKKCRVPQRKKLAVLPLTGLAAMGIYSALYFLNDGFAGIDPGDMTALRCLLVAALFEFLIESGLFQANMGYDSLFQQSMLAVQITDCDHHTRYRSQGARDFSPDILTEADETPVVLDQSVRLSGAAISGGHIYWQEDVSELLSVQEELEIAQEELRDTGDVLKAESEQKSYRLHLELENSLYDMVERQTARQVALLRDLAARLQQVEDLDAAKDLLGRIVVIGAYVKRRSNLIFVAGQEGSIRMEELLLCVKESAESLKLYGIGCRAEVTGSGRLQPETAYAAYDLLEAVIEESLDTASSVLFDGETEADGFHLTVCADCGADLAGLCQRFPKVSAWQDEDSLWYLTAVLAENGERGAAG